MPEERYALSRRGALLSQFPKETGYFDPGDDQTISHRTLGGWGTTDNGAYFLGGTTRSFPSLRRDCPEDDLLGSLAGEMIPYPIGFAEQPRVSYRALGGL